MIDETSMGNTGVKVPRRIVNVKRRLNNNNNTNNNNLIG